MKFVISGATVALSGAIMYPFWPDTTVLGPVWSSAVMVGVGLSIAVGGVCWSLTRD